MQFQVNTDKNISGHEALAQSVEADLRRSLERFGEQITRVEVHLSDENSTKKSGASDKRCLLEVRLAGRQPLSVSEEAATIEQAVTGAGHKMTRALDTELGKLGRH